MRSTTEMTDLILETAQKLPEVKAVAMSGSRANKSIPKDNFQDFDITYIVDDIDPFIKNRQWLDKLGKRLIMQTPDEMGLRANKAEEKFTFLMLFEDGNRIDLTLCSTSGIHPWLANEPVLKVLSDPYHLLTDVPDVSEKVYQIFPATQTAFAECCNEFWWVSTYVVKGLVRGELLYASDHLYTICQKELLRLLSWEAVLQKGPLNPGKNYKYLFNFLPLKQAPFEKLLNFSSINLCWQSLLATQDFFHSEAQNFAQAAGFDYMNTVAENIMDYTQEHYKAAQS
ncbi:aminoglycoside 6-adenylyltransferase [Tetragenococcus halophilus]|uniref:Aminoglycoside adenylyltransferase n=1 Tax=Tetragenococcus halophilus (strain DSM 20338 / JCM 20259 / NCIMB 9735 / NBRC 12172) TaxID=945021 RepID=A0AAN1VQ16_TETHN|nr:aminoglycoside 6-adenylyltransferase [Tetragenococcus halophilus]BAK93575.1 aminoglycoside adenylyltransferase [Tetragenococcus halophilus NBRC 12172]GBD69936.1 aminoglycoside adenylyltransferase [Tetragenococcus halophilus subsp. halophilus]GBD72970.1 aminoglycoside adenylyltransferase [Tetragenococcus halophilus subsp. halophilus]GBD74443.1 aminoglycoside adenylyltransferase [Tetragenococcus halophilus subsp. halophilus]GFK23472.1 aminoglycoside adenylyltransferase [Tetragenococcus haloph